jgi:uroporphyrinogen III methyltransferase/synthase
VSPLAGRRIVVTRPDGQVDELCARLEALGAWPIRLPTIDVLPPESTDALDFALRTLHEWDWVIFTSANGVRFALERSAAIGVTADAWRAVRVAAIGPATASALAAHGVTPAAVPEQYLAERIADVVGEVRGHRFLLLRADIAGALLPQKLRELGGYVEDVVAYRTAERDLDRNAAGLLAAGVDAITFTSPSTVRGLLRVLGPSWRGMLDGAAIISIGPVTSAAVRECGLTVDAEAEVHTTDGLLDALSNYFHASLGREVMP